jgi:hypothetical protein
MRLCSISNQLFVSESESAKPLIIRFASLPDKCPAGETPPLKKAPLPAPAQPALPGQGRAPGQDHKKKGGGGAAKGNYSRRRPEGKQGGVED